MDTIYKCVNVTCKSLQVAANVCRYVKQAGTQKKGEAASGFGKFTHSSPVFICA